MANRTIFIAVEDYKETKNKMIEMIKFLNANGIHICRISRIASTIDTIYTTIRFIPGYDIRGRYCDVAFGYDKWDTTRLTKSSKVKAPEITDPYAYILELEKGEK